MVCTPCVERVALMSSIPARKVSARFAVENMVISVSSSTGKKKPTAGDLSEYAPLRRRRLVLVSNDWSEKRAALPFWNATTMLPL